jgi:hypothetical protein
MNVLHIMLGIICVIVKVLKLVMQTLPTVLNKDFSIKTFFARRDQVR